MVGASAVYTRDAKSQHREAQVYVRHMVEGSAATTRDVADQVRYLSRTAQVCAKHMVKGGSNALTQRAKG